MSVAIEAGPLLPSTLPGEHGVGFEVIGIVSGRVSPLMLHANTGGGIDRADARPFWIWGVIGELPVARNLRLVGELNGGARRENCRTTQPCSASSGSPPRPTSSSTPVSGAESAVPRRIGSSPSASRSGFRWPRHQTVRRRDSVGSANPVSNTRADGYDAHIDGWTGFVVFVGPVGVWLRLVLNHVLNGPRFDAIRGPL